MKRWMGILGIALGTTAVSLLVGLLCVLAVKEWMIKPEGTAVVNMGGTDQSPAAGKADDTESVTDAKDHPEKENPSDSQSGTETQSDISGDAETEEGSPETTGQSDESEQPSGAEQLLDEAELLERGKVIYLTFDDGPGPYTEQLLDILAQYQVKATFFVTANFEDYFDLIAREKEDGHTVAIHTYSHVYKKIYADEEAYFADLKQMDDVILEQTGERAKLVRFPGGSSNLVSSFNPGIMTRLAGLLEEKGYRYFDWNVVSGDAGETEDTAQVVKNVIEGVQKKGVAVVLQHDLYEFSVDAVEQIIQWGLENGYVFLPLTMDSPDIHHTIAN